MQQDAAKEDKHCTAQTTTIEDSRTYASVEIRCCTCVAGLMVLQSTWPKPARFFSLSYCMQHKQCGVCVTSAACCWSLELLNCRLCMPFQMQRTHILSRRSCRKKLQAYMLTASAEFLAYQECCTHTPTEHHTTYSDSTSDSRRHAQDDYSMHLVSQPQQTCQLVKQPAISAGGHLQTSPLQAHCESRCHPAKCLGHHYQTPPSSTGPQQT